ESDPLTEITWNVMSGTALHGAGVSLPALAEDGFHLAAIGRSSSVDFLEAGEVFAFQRRGREDAEAVGLSGRRGACWPVRRRAGGLPCWNRRSCSGRRGRPAAGRRGGIFARAHPPACPRRCRAR